MGLQHCTPFLLRILSLSLSQSHFNFLFIHSWQVGGSCARLSGMGLQITFGTRFMIVIDLK